MHIKFFLGVGEEQGSICQIEMADRGVHHRLERRLTELRRLFRCWNITAAVAQQDDAAFRMLDSQIAHVEHMMDAGEKAQIQPDARRAQEWPSARGLVSVQNETCHHGFQMPPIKLEGFNFNAPAGTLLGGCNDLLLYVI